MSLRGEDLVNSLRNSLEHLESYIAVQSILRHSINIWHMEHISIGDRIRFVVAVLHNWLQMIPGYMASAIARALGISGASLRTAETYSRNAFECVNTLYKLGITCATVHSECPIFPTPSRQQREFLTQLGSILVYGGRRVYLTRHFQTKEKLYALFNNMNYPLQLHVDICHAQKWYKSSISVDDWCETWLRNVARIADAHNKTSLCRTHFDFGLGQVSATAPSVFVSTFFTSRDQLFTLATNFADAPEGSYELDSLGGWLNKTQLFVERQILNVTRFITKHTANEFSNYRNGLCKVETRKPLIYPYDFRASEALKADKAANDDSIWIPSNVIIFAAVALMLMVLGALISYSCSRHQERYARRVPDNRNVEHATELPTTTLRGLELQPLAHASYRRY
jgi:hypothetical protein